MAFMLADIPSELSENILTEVVRILRTIKLVVIVKEEILFINNALKSVLNKIYLKYLLRSGK